MHCMKWLVALHTQCNMAGWAVDNAATFVDTCPPVESTPMSTINNLRQMVMAWVKSTPEFSSVWM